MKITKTRLRQIIKEELKNVMEASSTKYDPPSPEGMKLVQQVYKEYEGKNPLSDKEVNTILRIGMGPGRTPKPSGAKILLSVYGAEEFQKVPERIKTTIERTDKVLRDWEKTYGTVWHQVKPARRAPLDKLYDQKFDLEQVASMIISSQRKDK